MRVRDIMTAPATVVPPEMKLRDLARLLIEHGISGAPVVAVDGQLVGMVTEADLIALEVEATVRQARGDATPIPREWVADDVMTQAVVTVEEDDPISEVAHLMVDHGIRRVPVVRQGEVVGIVSRRDVIGIFTRPDAAIAADVQELLDDVIKVIGPFRANVADGVVTLSGEADDEHRKLAEATARNVPGVVEVRSAG